MAKTALKIKTSVTKKTVSVLAEQSIEEAVIPHIKPMVGLNKKIKTLNSQISKIRKDYGAHELEVREAADVFLDNDEKIEISDGNNVLGISAKRKTRVIEDVTAIILALENIKEGLALEIASYSITELSKYFSKDEMEEFTATKLGNRTIKV